MDTPGKPMIYETTDEFLRSFGFSSIKDLPILELEVMRDSDSEAQTITGDQISDTE
jgi:segregation and condensation protein B